MSDRGTTTELLTPTPALALAGLLDLPTEAIVDGWALPPLWHSVYLLEHPATADLGPEGHARHGLPRPPAEGLRRMFGGGRVRTLRPLRLGAPARSTIEVTARREGQGRSGRLTIMTTTRTIEQAGAVAVVEQQDIVYREPAPVPAAPARTLPTDGLQPIAVNQVLLMRFSALTYNAHRIHYDVDYCRDVEGYPNLVVHGPLQALLMAEHSRIDGRPVPHEFAYRLLAPLCLGEGMLVGPGPDGTQVVTDGTGRMTASASWLPS